MFTERKTQYHPEVSSSQIDLQSQCDPNQNLASHFIHIDKVILRFMWKKNDQNNQHKIEMEEQS